jgi:hypothetical protein
MNNYIVSIDPGVKRTAAALFKDYSFYSCIYGEYDRVMLFLKSIPEYAHCIIEYPRIYQRSVGDPNDIRDLAYSVGKYSTIFTNTRLVEPREWKGQVPKKIHNARVLAAMTGEEKARMTYKNHNVIDAIGIGLWFMRRMKNVY